MAEQRQEVLINENTEKAMEIDSYVSNLLECVTDEQLTMTIAHHIMNMSDITEKYQEHYRNLSEKGIEL